MEKVLIVDNREKSRFEYVHDDAVCFLSYQMKEDKLYLIHNEVPEGMKGEGIGTALAEYGLRYGLSHQLKLVVICPFVRSYMKEHPDWRQELGN